VKLFVLVLALASGCGAINNDNESFSVFVQDSGGNGVADAVVTLNMSAENSDHVCGKTDERGTARMTWNSCQFGFNDCQTQPVSVTAAASGYRVGTTSIGFSQSTSATVKLTACDADASCPEPVACD
jgi:hypothetical protein